MYLNKQLSSWQQFKNALASRFGSSTYDDVQGKFFKLVQTTIVADYQSQFKALSNRTVGLSESFLMSCFISGIILAIPRYVQIAKHKDMMDVIWLAIMYEDKLND